MQLTILILKSWINVFLLQLRSWWGWVCDNCKSLKLIEGDAGLRVMVNRLDSWIAAQIRRVAPCTNLDQTCWKSTNYIVIWISRAFLCISLDSIAVSIFTFITIITNIIIILIIHHYSPLFTIINIIHYYSLLLKFDRTYRRPMDAILLKDSAIRSLKEEV